MSTPDPEGMSLLAKLLTAGIAILAPFAAAWRYFDGRLEKKADKHAVNNTVQEMKNELAHQRTVQAKLFDQLREDNQRVTDRIERLETAGQERFDKMMQAIYEGRRK